MANCTYTFTGADGKSITLKGIPALKEFLIEGGLARYLPERAAEMKAGNKADLDGQVDPGVSFSRREKPAPKKTVTAYKLFRVEKDRPGELFPLFVPVWGKSGPQKFSARDPRRHGEGLPIGKWYDAEVGETAPATKTGKPQVKSKLGGLAFRPGWHAGDLPIATHIGSKSDPNLVAPDQRSENHVWAEVKLPNDVNWQAEANKRGVNKNGKLIAKEAHITDQIPEDGFYRYKTNSNMTGNWLIGGSMKVTRILSDAEVKAINDAAGTADLPRAKPFDAEKYGFSLSAKQTDTPAFKKWFGKSVVADSKRNPLIVYHGTDALDDNTDDEAISQFRDYEPIWASRDPLFASGYATSRMRQANIEGAAYQGSPTMYPVYMSIQKPLVLTFDMNAGPKGAITLAKRIGADTAAFDGAEYAWQVVNTSEFARAARDAGYDGIVATEDGEQTYAALNATQVKSATGNNGEFDEANPDISFSKPQFFSQLQRGIESVPDRLATQPAAQWKAWLASNASKLGIKKDEIEWSGINDFLDLEGKNKLSREQVSAFLKDNGVRVQDVQYGTLTEQERHQEAQRIALDRYGEEYGDLDHSQQMDVDEDVEGETTAYSDYVLAGGDNYREMLITLPPAMRQRDIERMMYLEGKYSRLEKPARWVFEDSDEGKELKALQAKSKEGEYRNRHWQEANVVAHLRMNDRTDPEGNKVLFIEELQSDWGQEGRDKGFRGSKGFTVREDTSGKPELRSRWEVVDAEGNIEEGFISQAEAQRWADMEQKGQGVPKAPFVTKTEGWLNLALKRAIMAAVQGGYDKVAFVNGEQSADRYDLSKQIDSIKFGQPKEDGTIAWVAMKNGAKVAGERTATKDLGDAVGKELAQKILDNDGKAGELSGLDLKVGGEGMIKFYGAGKDPLAPVGTDKNGKPLYAIVPQTLNSLLPKLGGGKLGMTEINVAGREGRGEGLKVKYSYSGPTLTRAEISGVIADKDLSAGIEGQLRDIGRAVESGTPFAEAVVDYGSRAAAEALGGKLNILDRVPSQQLSFDVTDKMRETVSAGVPLFSRKQGRETEGWLTSRNEAGYVRFGAGAKGYRAVADVANVLLDKLRLKPMSPELELAIRKMKVEVDKARGMTVDVVKKMQELSQDERQMVSDVIEGELMVGVKPPKHILELATAISEIMTEQSDELVRLGMLTEKAAGRWEGKYLPRFYEQTLKSEAKGWAKAARNLVMPQRTMQGISGGSLKGRGQFQTINVEDLNDWIAEGWEVRDENFDSSKDDVITVWRDYSREERESMGEIRDAMFRFAMGYMRSQRDIALGRLYENLAKDFASRTEKEGYVQVPKSAIEDTVAKRYGALAGMWVPREIMDHLSANDESMQSELLKIYRSGLSKWKEGKTVLNPVAHANNVISNLTMAHFAGVSYWDGQKYLGALKDLINNADMVQEGKDAGLFGGTFNQSELVDMLPDELKEMAGKTESAVGRAGNMAWNIASLGLRKPLAIAYEAEDLFFRYLIYRDARNRGVDVDDAVTYAQKFIFTYDDLPKGARMVRDAPIGIPFISWTYKAIPILAQTAAEFPWRFAAPAGLVMGANAMGYALAAGATGDGDDDWWEIMKRYVVDADFREKARQLEKDERTKLPEWQKGLSIFGTAKVIRLGMDDVTGLPVFLDISRIFPGGDMGDFNNNTGGLPLPAWLTPNSPALSALTAYVMNRDAFTGKDVVDKDLDTPSEKAAKWGEWAYKQVMPAIAPFNYHFDRTMNALANSTGKDIDLYFREYTGTDKMGQPVQAKYAAMQTVGIKARPADLDVAEQINASKRNMQIREIEKQMRAVQRGNARGFYTDERADILLDRLNEKKQNLKEGLTVGGKERD